MDARLKLGVGGQFTMSGSHFVVVGTANDLTLLGGVPNAYVTLTDAQMVVFGGRPLLNAVLTAGVPRALPAGTDVYTNKRVEQASLIQMAAGRSWPHWCTSRRWSAHATLPC